MRRILVLITIMLIGCPSPKKTERPSEPPIPNGRTLVMDEEGQSRPTLAAQSVYGDSAQQEIDVMVGELTGLSFDMVGDATPEIMISSESATPFRALIYGPQDDLGLWGDVLNIAYGTAQLRIDDWQAPRNGHYLLLVQPLIAVPLSYTVTIDCPDCEANPCERSEPCNLYCPRGRALDPTTGCFECACAGSGCVIDGCSNTDDQCVLVCGDNRCSLGESCIEGRCELDACDGMCELGESCIDGECSIGQHECIPTRELCESACDLSYAPVCGEVDGQLRTVRNGCFAECTGLTEYTDGECDRGCRLASDCDAGQICENGECIRDPSCGCDPSANDPVCGQKSGDRKTFKNACQMRCEGYELEHPGRCIDLPRCITSTDCRGTERCVTVSDNIVSDNQSRCSEDFRDRSCVRACIPRRRCDSNAECEAEHQCLPMLEAAYCVPSCSRGAPRCDIGEVCVDGLLNTSTDIQRQPGVCLPACGANGQCYSDLSCIETLNACVPCSHCQDLPTSLVCDDGVPYENSCFQLCSQAFEVAANDRTMSVSEACNGIDDDCDGRVDEDLVRNCSTDSRQCSEGIQTCENGRWSSCQQVPQTTRESCNGVDDDCDGVVDENLVRACRTTSEICPQGNQTCTRGRWSACLSVELDVAEACNGKDDDCDGQVDENVRFEGEDIACNECFDCPLVWDPVCTETGLVPNACLASCSGLRILSLEDCGRAAAVRCESDRDCAISQCPSGNRVCGAPDSRSCATNSASAICYEEYAPCSCDLDRGVCAFVANDSVRRCLDDGSRQEQELDTESMR